MLVDANILIYAVDEQSPFHERARSWMEDALNGGRRVGLPWMSIAAFLRIVTHPRAMADPLGPADAWAIAMAWLDAGPVWIPEPGPGHALLRAPVMAPEDRLHGFLRQTVFQLQHAERNTLRATNANRSIELQKNRLTQRVIWQNHENRPSQVLGPTRFSTPRTGPPSATAEPRARTTTATLMSGFHGLC